MMQKPYIPNWPFCFSQALAVHVVILTTFFLVATVEAEEESYAKFNSQGELIRPEGWREWVYIGTPLTPNSLNKPEAAFPEFHSVYIDPQSCFRLVQGVGC